ncbi:neutral cholesterol ester hydrolase 1-like [Biomphalaria glabrata]|uniref:Neutral cholesterol ester hydrolase 1-like n=1 Tax=Biomphalaria glabrata TaxID=6526 RepID=A0A9W2Z191_BIOGL|nr:neutral cholesterol ester hydrolase 1-like [Biomphalaria glabrata]XP_055868827.1 neutral cholesterol ester hydrolase 1-like [Biomphalaria glabrata]XP_055868828.1 neutral cholesterol ester hydrolase 1-like [Biomphalaria glabrata]
MVTWLQKINIFLATIILLISFSLYTSVPADLEDPWIVRTYIAALRSANFLANTLELLSSVPSITTLRYLVEAAYFPIRLPNTLLHIEDFKINGLNVRLYRPKSAVELSPCILYFHGGGWSLFSIDSYDSVTRDLAQHTNTVVISVEYRQSPEFSFPVPFDDCLRVTQHILQNGLKYKIDSHRVALLGDSTGANLAAAVALRISEEDPGFTPHVRLQVLLQPVLQAFTFDTPSYRLYSDHTFPGRSQILKFWCYYLGIQPTQDVVSSFQKNDHVSPSLRTSIYSHYLSESQLPESVREKSPASSLDRYSNQYDQNLALKVESKVIDPFVSPLLADVLNASPPTYILVAEADVVRDDGLLYASRLRAANVSVELKHVHNQSHFFLAPKLPSGILTFTSADETWREIYQFISKNV